MLDDDEEKYRIDDEQINVGEICECGEPKRVQHLLCNKCKKYLQKDIQNKLKVYSRTDLEYISELLEGKYLPDYILGKEED